MWVLPTADAALAGSAADLGEGLREARRSHVQLACTGDAAVCGASNMRRGSSVAARAALSKAIADTTEGGVANFSTGARAAADAPFLPMESFEQREFFAELAALYQVALEGGDGDLTTTTTTPRLDVLVSSRFRDLPDEDKAAAAALVEAAAKAAAAATRGGVVALARVDPEGPDVHRILSSSTDALTPASGSSANSTFYTLEQAREFQIGLWTAVALFCVALAAVLAMVNMKPEYDSLLTATFQANVTTISKLE